MTSATLGANQERLWGSWDNGATWTDLSDRVDGSGHLTWSGVTLAGSGVLRFKVMDIAGNAGTEFSQHYTLDQTAPDAAITGVRFLEDTGVDELTRRDFITSAAETSLDFSFNHALSSGDHVYVQWGVGETPIDITQQMLAQGLFGAERTANVDGFRLLSGLNTLTCWVEDQAGNKGLVLTQNYVYAPAAPRFDLSISDPTSRDARVSVDAPAAQHGIALSSGAQVEDLPAGVAQIIVSYSTEISDNGANERLLITPGVDIDLSWAAASAGPLGFAVNGISGSVRLEPWGGSELHFSKVDSTGAVSYFTSTEVSALLQGLRYFNTASASAIEAGVREFDIQLIDRAHNFSSPQSSFINLRAAGPVSGRDATPADDVLTGTAADDVMLGLGGQDILIGGQGNDVMWGHGGHSVSDPVGSDNNLFKWLAGDASSSATPHAATDLIRDFRAWNGIHGDRLDIAGLLENYTAGMADQLSQWVQIDNQATVQGVRNSTRLTIDVNGSQSGGDIQIIELQGVALSTTSASELVASQLLKVL
jgi:hypothetical protein